MVIQIYHIKSYTKIKNNFLHKEKMHSVSSHEFIFHSSSIFLFFFLNEFTSSDGVLQNFSKNMTEQEKNVKANRMTKYQTVFLWEKKK